MGNTILNLINNSVEVYLLVLSRMLGFFLVAPMFSRTNIPSTVKVGLSVVMSYVILPFVIFTSQTSNNNLFMFILMIAIELLIGLGLGLVAHTIFSIFIAAGANADLQIGFSMAQMVDPSFGMQVTVSGFLFNAYAFLIFFAVNGHHYLIRALLNSYDILPIGKIGTINESMLEFIIKLMAYILQTSILFIIPILITILLGNILLAFMSKTMPQMNVFIVGMPFKILVGLSIMFISLPFTKILTVKIFKEMYKFMYLFLRLLKG